MTSRLAIGCMTGTSIDALDVAIVNARGTGLELQADLEDFISVPLGPLAARLRAAAEQKKMNAAQFAELAHDFALAHVAAIKRIMSQAFAGRGSRVSLVSVHGQTVFHQPPFSWQLINAPVIAHGVGAPVIFDLRGGDLAAGGQGAPITPLADWVLFRSERRRAIVNLGGFCNVTILPALGGGDAKSALAKIQGLDVCACNHVLDAAARIALNRPFDEDGKAAAAGRADAAKVATLADMLTRQRAMGRSLGTGDEMALHLTSWQATMSPNDLCATACAAVAKAIAAVIPGQCEVLAAGGGTRNATLMRELAIARGEQVHTTAIAKIPPDTREAVAMAVLGLLSIDRVPITLPQVTGCGTVAPIAGSVCCPSATASSIK